MASGPITSWQINGKKVETARNFIFLGSKITVDGDCSHEIKRLLERKAMTNLDSILKSRDITLPTKVHLVKAMVFPVIMYGCESWTIKKSEHQRIDVSEPWYQRRLLRVVGLLEIKPVHPKGNQPWIFARKTDAKAEAPIFCPPDAKSDSLEKTPILGKIEGRRRRGQQRMRWLDNITTQWTWIWANSRRPLKTGKPVVHGIPKSWTWLSNWATTTAA